MKITYGALTYSPKGGRMNVYLEDKVVGSILQVHEGWQYVPRLSKQKGEVFPLLQECKRSLEAK